MRDLGHVPTLKSRGRKLVLTCHTLAFAPSDCVSAISLSEGVVGRENEGIPDSRSRTL